MQDDQYDDKRLMWMKEDLRPEHIMHTNQMIPFDMGSRHPIELTDLGNTMMDGRLGNNDLVDMSEIAGKKKRGRPKKVRGEGEEVVKKPSVKRPKPVPQDFNGEMPQKKRGRPKKGMGDGSEQSPRPVKTPQSFNGDMPKKKRGRPKKSKGDKDDGSFSVNEMSQGGTNDSRAPNDYMASMYSHSPVNSCSSLSQHQPLRLYDQPPPNKFGVGGNNYFGLGASPNAQLNNTTGNYSQSYHSQHQQHPHQHQHQHQHQYAHSNLSSEISAAISTAEHLGNADDVNSPASASPNLGPSNFDQQSGMLSGNSTPHQLQQANSNICYSPYRNTPPSNDYMHLQQTTPQPHSRQSSHNDTLNDGYLSSQPPPPSLNSHGMNEPYPGQHHQHPYHHQPGPSAPSQMQRQPPAALNDIYNSKMMNASDVTAKSLSGLESLVDQIPSLSSYSTDTGNASNTIDEHSLNDMRSVMDNPINELSQMPCNEQQATVQQEPQSQFETNCIYTSNYSPAGSSGNIGGCPIISNSPDIGGNNNRSRSSEGAGSATPNSNISHQPVSANFSPSPMTMQGNAAAAASPSAQTPPANNSYSSLCSPFSVSSLTASGSHSYTPTGSPTSAAIAMNSYHSNLMAAAIQNSIPPPSALYMEPPHLPMAVNPLYHPHHAYPPQHHHPGYPPTSGYGSMTHHLQYQQQQQQLQEQSLSGTGLLHMPSPNYPYGYGSNSATMSYHQHSATASNHHPTHSASGYLTGHHTMFDRIKPDGLGGYNG